MNNLVVRMVLTNDLELPSYEELTVPEVRLSSPILRASGVYFGKYCDEISKVNYCYCLC